MPPLATELIDPDGLTRVSTWIESYLNLRRFIADLLIPRLA